MEPQKRIETLQRFGERLTKAKAVKETWSKWGMELESQPKSLKGRELLPEPVFLKNSLKPFEYKAENADWTNGKSKQPFFTTLRAKRAHLTSDYCMHYTAFSMWPRRLWRTLVERHRRQSQREKAVEQVLRKLRARVEQRPPAALLLRLSSCSKLLEVVQVCFIS